LGELRVWRGVHVLGWASFGGRQVWECEILGEHSRPADPYCVSYLTPRHTPMLVFIQHSSPPPTPTPLTPSNAALT
jgi:hypothetical protein